MRSFIIHMPGDEKRAPNAKRLLSDLPDAVILPAVDGRDPHQIAEVDWCNGTLLRPHYPFPMSAGEIGLFQSYRACWQKIVDDGDRFALIAEDDLSVSPDLLYRALALIKAHATPDMFIRLPVKNRERPAEFVAREGDMTFYLPRVAGLQTVCQVVGADAARRLLAASDRIDRPVDVFLQMHWVTGQAMHTIWPNGNREIGHEIGGSTIQSKVRGKARMAREFNRSRYRAQVALRPQKA